MQHVAGEAALAQLPAHLAALLRGEVRHAAHPRSVAPERHVSREAGHAAVVVEDALQAAAAEEEQVHRRLGHGRARRPRGHARQRQSHELRRVYQQAIGAAGDEQRHVLVRAAAVDAQSVGVLQHEGPPGEVEVAESLPRAGKAFAGRRVEAERRAVRPAGPFDKAQRQRVDALRAELVVRHELDGRFAVREHRREERLAGSLQQRGPLLDWWVGRVDPHADGAVVVGDIPAGRRLPHVQRHGLEALVPFQHGALVAGQLPGERGRDAHHAFAIGPDEHFVRPAFGLGLGRGRPGFGRAEGHGEDHGAASLDG